MSVPPLSRDRARQLRRQQTDAERRLWMRLREHQLGVQFRRQHPIGPYVVDFCCVERIWSLSSTAGIMKTNALGTLSARGGSASKGFV
jgi:hypothetical protein